MPPLKTSYRSKGQRVEKRQYHKVLELLKSGLAARQVAISVGVSEFFVFRIKHGLIPYYLLGIKVKPWNYGMGRHDGTRTA